MVQEEKWQKPRRELRIDFDEMRELVDVSIRRASAFLRFGLDDLDQRDGGDFTLAAGSRYAFWPKDIEKGVRDTVRTEFRSWLIGSCLRELDQHYSLFLDYVWFAIEVVELKGRVPAEHKFDKSFARKTNVAEKHRQIAAKLNVEDNYEELNSLSLARNSLTHNAGFVRSPVDCNNPARDKLEIKWLAFDFFASRGGEEIQIKEMPFDVEQLPGSGEVTISIKFAQRILAVTAKERIVLGLQELAELCLFYKSLSERVYEALLRIYRSAGLLPSSSPEAT